jgi:nitroreductase
MQTEMTKLILAALVLFPLAVAESIQLPAPQTDGGKPLMQALKLRATIREFRSDSLPKQVLSNLLWAAFGINRPDGKRTAPSAHNKQEIDVYVVMPDATYVFDARENRLVHAVSADLRPLAAAEAFAIAPVTLVYIADFGKVEGTPEDKLQWTGADAGSIGQNVYLFCASEGLATVIHASSDRPALAKALKLRPEQKIVLAQTVGYRK